MAELLNIDYTSRDFDGLRQSLLDYASQTFPDWTPSSEGDFGVMLLELLAYCGDILSYYCDRAQNEAYLSTATQRSSLLSIANLLGYTPNTGAPASGTVTLIAATNGAAVVVPEGTKLATAFVSSLDSQIIFETQEEVTVPAYSASPNTVDVTVLEGTTQVDPTTGGPVDLGDSTGLPSQSIMLSSPNVYVDSVEVYVAGTQWVVVDSLLGSGPNDQVVSLFTDANNYTWIIFGDGLMGAIPNVGLDITASYRTGVGAAGNLPYGSIISLYDTSVVGFAIQKDPNSQGLSTSTATTGGADPETNDQIRANAPQVFNAQQRAVTLADFAAFALSVSGVSKANAVAGSFSSVTVYVMGPDGDTASTSVIDSVLTKLQSVALAGVSITVDSASQVGINLGTSASPVVITVWPTYAQAAVQSQVEAAVAARLGVSQTNIGDVLTVSDFYATIMGVDGVRYVDIPVMARADSAQSGTAEIDLQGWELPVLGTFYDSYSGGIS